MAFLKNCLACLRIILVLGIGFVGCDEVSTTPRFPEPGNGTTISLADFGNADPNGKGVWKRIMLMPFHDSSIEVKDIPIVVSFIILQIHAPERNLTLSYELSYFPDDDYPSSSNVSGSNIGLEFYVDGNSSARFNVTNNEKIPVEALIAVVAYGFGAPTPGGCNLEFDVQTSPFQKLTVDSATITVDSQPASAPRINGTVPSCDKYSVKLETYLMYLPEHQFSVETYFDGIKKMMTVKNIIENGQKIHPASGASMLHRVYAAYPGTGSIYAVVATYGNISAAYVPIATYACSHYADPSSCEDLTTGTEKFVCALVLIIGLLITFVGHKCLGFELTLIGAMTGGLVSFCIINYFGFPGAWTILGTSFLSGICMLVLSSCAGILCLAKFLPTITFGLLVSSTFYFFTGADYAWLESDGNFWLAYATMTVLAAVVVAIATIDFEDSCCGILGAYATVLSIDYYAGSNLKYVIINTIRRITVHGFNAAVVQPPYQTTEKYLVALFVIFSFLGMYVRTGRSCCCKGRNSTTVYWQDAPRMPSLPRRGRRVLVLGDHDRVETNYRF